MYLISKDDFNKLSMLNEKFLNILLIVNAHAKIAHRYAIMLNGVKADQKRII